MARGGMGSVMGSKDLKTIVVEFAKKKTAIDFADKDGKYLISGFEYDGGPDRRQLPDRDLDIIARIETLMLEKKFNRAA